MTTCKVSVMLHATLCDNNYNNYMRSVVPCSFPIFSYLKQYRWHNDCAATYSSRVSFYNITLLAKTLKYPTSRKCLKPYIKIFLRYCLSIFADNIKKPKVICLYSRESWSLIS